MQHAITSRALRGTVATALILSAVGSVVWAALQPPFPEGTAARLAAIEAAGSGASVSAFLFTLFQLPWMVAVLGIAWLARGSRKAATSGGFLAVLGGFGHAVFGGAMLVSILMARDIENRGVHAGTLDAMESWPLLMVFAAAGLLGTVLGTVLLAVALWRSHVVPRWVPLLLWAFVVVEFVGANISEYATYVSSLCLLTAFGALARLALWGAEDAGTAREAALVSH